jgi:hypothetical protein
MFAELDPTRYYGSKWQRVRVSTQTNIQLCW